MNRFIVKFLFFQYTNQRNVNENIVDEKSNILNAGVIEDAYEGIGHTSVYYEAALSTCDEVGVDYKPPLSSMLLSSTKMEEPWGNNTQYEASSMVIFLFVSPVSFIVYFFIDFMGELFVQ